MTAKKPSPKGHQKPANAPTSSPKSSSGGQGREMEYPQIKELKLWGDTPFTVSHAVKFMGMVTEGDDEDFKDDFLFKDVLGKKVRCTKNVANRPLYMSNVEDLQQKILRKHWAGPNGKGATLNPEPIIIGQYGSVLDGQHQCIAVYLAEQERTIGKDAANLQKVWPNPIVIDKLVILGISEDDDVVNTMNTCKPRSIADVLYRMPYFKKMKPKVRVEAAKICDVAIKMLWVRTGANLDAFSGRRTHDEAVDFLNRHKRLLDCVKHIMEEYAVKGSDKEAKAKCYRARKLFAPGYAAALMYLMACSASGEEDYRNSRTGVASENKLDFSLITKAEEFWLHFAGGSDGLDAIETAISSLIGPYSSPDKYERSAIVTNAWNAWLKGELWDSDSLLLKEGVDYATTASGRRVITKPFDLKGIDRGIPVKKLEEEKEEQEAPTGDESEAVPDEVAKAEVETGTLEVPDLSGTLDSLANETPEQEKARRESMQNGNGQGHPAEEQKKPKPKKKKKEKTFPFRGPETQK